jgi:hypothetical protein
LECSGDEEGTLRKKIFSDGRDFLRRGCGGEGQKQMVFFSFSLPFPGLPLLGRAMNSRKASIRRSSLLLSSKKFLPMGVGGDVVQQRRGLRF